MSARERIETVSAQRTGPHSEATLAEATQLLVELEAVCGDYGIDRDTLDYVASLAAVALDAVVMRRMDEEAVR